jgi:hypothetical protein
MQNERDAAQSSKDHEYLINGLPPVARERLRSMLRNDYLHKQHKLVGTTRGSTEMYPTRCHCPEKTMTRFSKEVFQLMLSNGL